MKLLIPVVLLLASTGCTDAGCSRLTSRVTGAHARVTCHSGGKVIFDGCSTGKVNTEHQSDGYFFRDKETQRLVEVSGECFLDYEAPCPAASIRPNVTAPSVQ